MESQSKPPLIDEAASAFFVEFLQVAIFKDRSDTEKIARSCKNFVMLAENSASPIEQMMAGILVCFVELGTRGEEVRIRPQAPLGKYKADFAIRVDGKVYAIECDGHDFHERTKEQAKKDRTRDRFLLSRGIETIRFTGSELHSEPGRCLKELIAIVAKRKREAA